MRDGRWLQGSVSSYGGSHGSSSDRRSRGRVLLRGKPLLLKAAYVPGVRCGSMTYQRQRIGAPTMIAFSSLALRFSFMQS